MIRLTQAEVDAHKARLKAQGNVRTHHCGDEDEIAGQERLQNRQGGQKQARYGTNGGLAVGKGAQAGKAPPIAQIQAEQALQAGVLAGKRSKHGAVKTAVDGERFDSKLEAKIWADLKLAEATGNIRHLRRQVKFSLFAPGGEHLGTYTADFVYDVAPWNGLGWHRRVADAKSAHTRKLPGWNRTKTLMMACHNIDVLELP